MPLRIKIITPIRVDDADLQRRQRRYSEHAGQQTKVNVVGLESGPVALDTRGDLLFCEHAVFEEGMATKPEDYDAILVDCIFDPAVEPLQAESSIHVFGPMRSTLSLVAQLVPRFSIVARAERHCEIAADLVRRYGYGDQLASTRALGISYPQARNPTIFNTAMRSHLKLAVEEDGAGAIVMGSTTMALADDVAVAAGKARVFLPGLVALRVIELLWQEGLLA